MTPAASLQKSAATFRKAGRAFDAAFTSDMIPAAKDMPCLYQHYAAAQAERAARVSA